MVTAYLYAGQGMQHRGMGKDLYESYACFRKMFDEACGDEQSPGALDFDLRSMCFEDPDGELSQTQYTQPCMTAVNVGITHILREQGLRPDYVCGLSLGEYAALEAAGVFTAREAVEVTAFRGWAMAQAAEGIPSAMIAVLGLEEGILGKCCEEASSLGIVSIANHNCPGQLVIGGEKAAVEKAALYAREAGAARCIPLAVSGPFHTRLMAPAGEKLDEYLRSMELGPMQIPVLFNCLGDENREGRSIRELLVRQLQSTVRMEATLRRLFALGVTEFVEIGPGKVLTGFVRKTAKELGIRGYTTWSIETAEDAERYLESLKAALGH